MAVGGSDIADERVIAPKTACVSPLFDYYLK